MAKVSEVYGGAYLTGADLKGQTHRMTVQQVPLEEVGDEREQKLVVYFHNAKKGLVLNKTNASTLVSAFGDDTDLWVGKLVELFTVPVNFNGRTYDGIRVRASADPVVAAPVATSAPIGVPASQTKAAMAAAAGTDDCPF